MALIIIFVLAGLWLLPGGVGAGPGLPLGSPPAAPAMATPAEAAEGSTRSGRFSLAMRMFSATRARSSMPSRR